MTPTGQGDTIGAVLEREFTIRLGQPVEVAVSGQNNLANAWFHWQTHVREIQPHIVLMGLTVGNDLTSHNCRRDERGLDGSSDPLITQLMF